MGRWATRIGISIVALVFSYVSLVGIGGGLALTWALTPGRVDWSQSKQPSPKDPLEIGYRGDPKTALGYDFETVDYTTELGPAEAWLVSAPTPSAAPPTTWAIEVHGIGGIRENGYRQLSILHAAGFPALLITYRNDAGAPASNPPFYAFGLSEWRDLDAAVDYALQHGARHVIIVTESMGGGITGQFLAHSQRAGAVEALVLDAPAVDFNAVADWALDQYHLPLGDQLAGVATGIASTWAPAPLETANVFDVIAKFPGPVFLSQGRADRLVPVTLTRRLVAARTGPTTYLETDADHLHSFKLEPQRFRAELTAFLAGLPKN